MPMPSILNDAIPGEDDLCHFRYRVGAQAISTTMAAVAQLFSTVGLINGELLSTDGQLEASHSRYKGCAYGRSASSVNIITRLIRSLYVPRNSAILILQLPYK